MIILPPPPIHHIRKAISSRWRIDRLTLLLVGLSLLTAGIVLLRTSFYGAGINTDAINFVGIARNILAGNGPVDILSAYDNDLSLWVPLYPLTLVIFSFGLFDPYDVAGPVNAIIAGLTVFAVGHYLSRRLESRFVALLATLAAASSFPLIWMASFAMSDTLFILMSTLALIYCDKFLEQGKTSALIWTAVFSMLACQTRYIGLAAPAVIGIMLLLQRDAGLVPRVKRVGLYSLIVALPLALWMFYTYLLIGSPIREPRTVDYSIWSAFDDIIATFVAGYDDILLIPFIQRIPDVVWTGMAVLLTLFAVTFAVILWQAIVKGRAGGGGP